MAEARNDRVVCVPARMTAVKIADEMEQRIRSGEYKLGSRLPTTQELANLYGVGTTTASKAYFILKLKGLVEGEQGIGVFVVDRLP